MHRGLWALGFALMLAGCFPVDVYHRTGVTVQRQQNDVLACEVKALRKAPVDKRIAQAPPYYVPPREICRNTDKGPQCWMTGGYWEDGEIYTYDANKALRAKVMAQCAAAKGYTKARLPQCSKAQIADAGAVSSRMPALGAGSCVARGVGGAWVVIGG